MAWSSYLSSHQSTTFGTIRRISKSLEVRLVQHHLATHWRRHWNLLPGDRSSWDIMKNNLLILDGRWVLGVPMTFFANSTSKALSAGKRRTSRARATRPLAIETICSSVDHLVPSHSSAIHLSFMIMPCSLPCNFTITMIANSTTSP